MPIWLFPEKPGSEFFSQAPPLRRSELNLISTARPNSPARIRAARSTSASSSAVRPVLPLPHIVAP